MEFSIKKTRESSLKMQERTDLFDYRWRGLRKLVQSLQAAASGLDTGLIEMQILGQKEHQAVQQNWSTECPRYQAILMEVRYSFWTQWNNKLLHIFKTRSNALKLLTMKMERSSALPVSK